MSTADKAKDKAEELKGAAKEHLGNMTGNDRLADEGRADQAKAKAKQVGEDLKDAAKDAKDAMNK